MYLIENNLYILCFLLKRASKTLYKGKEDHSSALN